MIYLYIYLIFASCVTLLYVYLFHVYKMPDTVKNARTSEKLRVYAMLIGSIFLIAPYGLYEIIKEYKNGGFKK